MKTAGFGWRPDFPDHRDLKYDALAPRRLLRAAVRPMRVQLSRSMFPEIYDQGQLGSCVGNGVSRVLSYTEATEGHGTDPMSRLFLYFNARFLDGSDTDSGTQIRSGIKGVVRFGACLETSWPYDVATYNDPPGEAYTEGKHRSRGLKYARIQGLSQMMDCLASGYPVVFGTVLFEAFENVTPDDALVPMPQQTDTPIGGHCMVLVGYDRRARTFTVANSWGATWGEAGYCRMPFEYVGNENLATDFWTVRHIAK